MSTATPDQPNQPDPATQPQDPDAQPGTVPQPNTPDEDTQPYDPATDDDTDDDKRRRRGV